MQHHILQPIGFSAKGINLIGLLLATYEEEFEENRYVIYAQQRIAITDSNYQTILMIDVHPYMIQQYEAILSTTYTAEQLAQHNQIVDRAQQ